MASVGRKKINLIVFACFVCVGAGAIIFLMGRKHKTSTEWMSHVNAVVPSGSAGRFLGKDNFDEPVVIEWEKATGKESRYLKNMRRIADVTSQAFTEIEVDFLREHSDLVGQDAYYKLVEPLFVAGPEHVDWSVVADTMRTMIKTMLLSDISKLAPDDIYFFVTVTNARTQELLGAAVFLVTSAYAYGDIKVISIGVQPDAQGRGLGKLMMSSLFKIVPDCSRIFLATRTTNNGAQRAYFAWGFTREEQPSQDPRYPLQEDHWMFFEYCAESSTRLQDAAQLLHVSEEKTVLLSDAVYKIISEVDFSRATIDDCVRLSALDKQSGFMHLSFGRQVMSTVSKFFKGARRLLVLEIDTDVLQEHGVVLRVESNKPGGEQYPHLYGPQKIPLSAVKKVWQLVERDGGSWNLYD